MSPDQYPPQYPPPEPHGGPPPGPYGGPPPFHPQGYPQAGHPQAGYPPGQPQAGYYGQTFAPYGAPPAPFPGRPRRSRGPLIAALAALGLLLVLGGGAAAVNAYAKHTVCTAMESTGTTSASTARSTTDAIATMHDTADRMRTYSRMLLFDRTLRAAVTGLAEDVEELATISTGLTTDQVGTAALTHFFEVVNSVNTHARDAQRACGLPANGIA